MAEDKDRKIITWKQAKESGLKRYFTGKPCKYGHIAERHVSSFGCMICSKERSQKFWYNHHDVAIQKNREWKCKNRERANLSAKKSKLKYKNIILQRQRDAYWADPQKARNVQKEWRERNPEKVRATIHRCQARRKNASGWYTAKQIRDLREKQKYKCANCHCCVKNSYHIDHILPISKGGSNDIKNIQILCELCNLRKHAKDPLQWARENGRLL